MTHTRNLILLPIIASMAIYAGCRSGGTKYVDPSGPNTITSTNKINVQDWDKAAHAMINSLLSSNVFANTDKPVILGISRIVNDTSSHIDTGRLTKKIRIALNKSGKCMTTMTVGLGGKAEDPMAADTKEYNDFVNNKKSKAAMPEYTLSGKILQDNVRAGRVKQVVYTFQLSLTKVDNGLAVWEDEKSIGKQGTRASVGW